MYITDQKKLWADSLSQVSLCFLMPALSLCNSPTFLDTLQVTNFPWNHSFCHYIKPWIFPFQSISLIWPFFLTSLTLFLLFISLAELSPAHLHSHLHAYMPDFMIHSTFQHPILVHQRNIVWLCLSVFDLPVFLGICLLLTSVKRTSI